MGPKSFRKLSLEQYEQLDQIVSSTNGSAGLDSVESPCLETWVRCYWATWARPNRRRAGGWRLAQIGKIDMCLVEDRENLVPCWRWSWSGWARGRRRGGLWRRLEPRGSPALLLVVSRPTVAGTRGGTRCCTVDIAAVKPEHRRSLNSSRAKELTQVSQKWESKTFFGRTESD